MSKPFGTFYLDNAKQARDAGFAVFNENPHVCIDLPDGQTTLSVRTSDGRRVTFAFLPYKPDAAPECVDICYHDAGMTRENARGEGVPVFDLIAFGPPNQGKDYDTRRARPEPGDKPGIVCLLMPKKE